MRANRLEGEVKAAITAYLALRGDLFSFRNNTGGFSPRPGEFLQFGAKGSADILAVQAPHGRFIGIETKRERGGVLSEDQRLWGENLTRFGGLYIVARSVEDVRAALGEPTVRVTLKGPTRVFAR